MILFIYFNPLRIPLTMANVDSGTSSVVCRSKYPEMTSGTTRLCSSIRVIRRFVNAICSWQYIVPFYRRAANIPVFDMRLTIPSRADRYFSKRHSRI